MNILVDTHTHTLASTHAYSTLYENITAAKAKGLQMLCVTDHAPGYLPDTPHMWHFRNMRDLPREVDGLKMLYGIEVSIMDTDGNTDLPEELYPGLEVVIASIHRPVYMPKTKEKHTETWLNIMKNPTVDICGHSGNPLFQYDIEPVIRAAKEAGKAIEINNHSFKFRKGSGEICRKIAIACKNEGTKIVVGSDAHSLFQIGKFDDAIKMLEEIDFPEELIMNLTAEKFENFLRERRAKQ